MSFWKNMRGSVNRLLNVPISDPDDARRRRLLNIILAGVFVLSVLTLIVTAAAKAFNALTATEFITLLLTGLVLATSVFIFYAVNRYVSGELASVLFLVFLLAALGFTDEPQYIANGRSTFVFIIPIIMSSVLLRPISSFIFAALGSVALIVFADIAGVNPNTFVMVGFVMIALISWLSARSLEQALVEVRVTNAELDQRVHERTRELTQALTREQAEAGRRQAILLGIADGVIVFDNQSRAIMANPAISRLLDIPISRIVGSGLEDLLNAPQLEEADRKTLLRLIGVQETTLPTARIRWGEKTLSASAAPVRDAHGSMIGNVAVLRDFTREAEIEQMKNAFIAMVSHELRTPLNAILGYSEMLKEAFYGPVNEKQASAAGRILANSQRLLSIVSDLLDQAQIEAGRLVFQISDFRTAEIIDNMHSVMDKPAQDKGLALQAVVEADMPESLRSDPYRIQQIMLNLVNNAVKFTDKGSIAIRVYKKTDRFWAFDVSDTGPGITLEAQHYIFDPFRQIAGVATRSQGGIGLGLSIVKRLVNLMGGDIIVHSLIGQGSTFTVTLPFQLPQEVKT
jgi:signal transduction histidine kinase